MVYTNHENIFTTKFSRSTVHAVMREEESNSEKLAVAKGTTPGGLNYDNQTTISPYGCLVTTSPYGCLVVFAQL